MTLVEATSIAWKIFFCCLISVPVLFGLFSMFMETMRDIKGLVITLAVLFISSIVITALSFLTAVFLTIFAYY